MARLESPIDDNEVALVMPEPGALALLEREGQVARDYGRESLSPGTRRAYRTDIDAFMAWCRGRWVDDAPIWLPAAHRPFRDPCVSA